MSIPLSINRNRWCENEINILRVCYNQYKGNRNVVELAGTLASTKLHRTREACISKIRQLIREKQKRKLALKTNNGRVYTKDEVLKILNDFAPFVANEKIKQWFENQN
jgi:argonaute-like protein implicated in RNA metabolism and viral defense